MLPALRNKRALGQTVAPHVKERRPDTPAPPSAAPMLRMPMCSTLEYAEHPLEIARASRNSAATSIENKSNGQQRPVGDRACAGRARPPRAPAAWP